VEGRVGPSTGAINAPDTFSTVGILGLCGAQYPPSTGLEILKDFSGKIKYPPFIPQLFFEKNFQLKEKAEGFLAGFCKNYCT
jgi:hypothetical protein